MTISADEIYKLNTQMGEVANQVQLGTLIANAEAVTAGEIALADGSVLIGNASGVAAANTLTGDVTTTNAGVTAIGANKVTKAMLATDVMVETTGTLTQANLQAIGTPISLISAPGAGKVIIVDEIELLHTYSTTVYATGADVQFEYATSGDNITLVDSAFVTGGANQNTIIKPSTYDLDGATGTGVGFDVTASANKAVQVTGSNFTNGNVANIVKWRIRYHVVTLLT